MNMGADKNMLYLLEGLSALGHFRETYRKEEMPRIMFGLPELSAEVKEEVVRMEPLLRPINGPTNTDDALLESKDESESDYDDN